MNCWIKSKRQFGSQRWMLGKDTIIFGCEKEMSGKQLSKRHEDSSNHWSCSLGYVIHHQHFKRSWITFFNNSLIATVSSCTWTIFSYSQSHWKNIGSWSKRSCKL